MLHQLCSLLFRLTYPKDTQADLAGQTRLLDPYEGLESLTADFENVLRFVSHYSRVAAPDEYYLNLVANVDDDGERYRPEDSIDACWVSFHHFSAYNMNGHN
jgi:hypothetical protein